MYVRYLGHSKKSMFTSLYLYYVVVWCDSEWIMDSKGKGKDFSYSLPSFGPGADPGVQAVSPHVTDYKSSTRR